MRDNGSETGYDIATDSAGNTWVTGTTDSDDLGSGPFASSLAGVSDAFVAKISPAGELLWATYVGGDANDHGQSVAVDASGNAWITGNTSSSGWVSGGFDTTLDGADAFVAQISPTGELLWSSYLGGLSTEEGRSIAIDNAGNVWVSGMTHSSGWVTGGFDTTYGGNGGDGFVVKISPTQQLLWSSYLGAGGIDEANDVVVDASGEAWVTGTTYSSGWVSGGSDTSYGGAGDGFVAKISADGQILWSNYFGGSGTETGFGIAVDAAGNGWVTGWSYVYGETTQWVSGGFDTSHGGEDDGIVAKISKDGQILWSTYLGGPGFDRGLSIAANEHGDAWVTGYTNFDGWISSVFNTNYDGSQDAFVAKISTGGQLVWANYLGAENLDEAFAVTVDATGNVWVAGGTESADWVLGGFDTSMDGTRDAFVFQISNHPAQLPYSRSAYQRIPPSRSRRTLQRSTERRLAARITLSSAARLRSSRVGCSSAPLRLP